MKIKCFAKYYDDISKSYEYFYYGVNIYSSENLNEDEVEVLLHHLESQ